MADQKGSTFATLLGTALTLTDRVHVIDVSDTTTTPAGPAGSNKTMTVTEFMAGFNSLGGGSLVKAGIAGGQTAVGGTAATDQLILKATSGPTSGAASQVSIFGGAAEGLRVGQIPAGYFAGAVGKPMIAMGDISGATYGHATVRIKRGTLSSSASVAPGTGLLVHGGDDDAKDAAGNVTSSRGIDVVWRTSLPGNESSALGVTQYNEDTVGGNNPDAIGGPRLINLADQAAQTNLFSMNPVVENGRFFTPADGARPNGSGGVNGGAYDDPNFDWIPWSGVKKHPYINAVEIDLMDRASNIATNPGFAIRAECSGINDAMNAVLIAHHEQLPGAWRNGITCSTNLRGLASTEVFNAAHSYQIGQAVRLGSGAVYVAMKNFAVNVAPTPSGNGDGVNWWKPWTAHGPVDNFIWYGGTQPGYRPDPADTTPYFQVDGGGNTCQRGFIAFGDNTTGARLMAGAGVPGALAAPNGSVYLNTTANVANTAVYARRQGAWVALTGG